VERVDEPVRAPLPAIRLARLRLEGLRVGHGEPFEQHAREASVGLARHDARVAQLRLGAQVEAEHLVVRAMERAEVAASVRFRRIGDAS
jgi:hypothetical protein